MIRLGLSEAQSVLHQILEKTGEYQLALDYFNCGNTQLENAARIWASRHGYELYRSPELEKIVKWGMSNVSRYDDAFYVPIYDEGKNFNGIWVKEPDHPNLSMILRTFIARSGFGVEIFEAFSSGRYRRVANERTEIGDNVQFYGGAFLMLGNARAPNEFSPPNYPTTDPDAKLWFSDISLRGHPLPPQEIDLGRIAIFSISNWMDKVSYAPHGNYATRVEISKIDNVISKFVEVLKNNHGLKSKDLVDLLSTHLAAACASCTAGVR